MKRLYILYDSQCELCRRCRIWLGRQPAYVPLVFIPFQSPEAECRFPTIKDLHPEKEIVVVSDAGAVWQGEAAWVTCLWALREYREWSQRFANPALLPFARRLCEMVSTHRYRISQWLRPGSSNEVIQHQLASLPSRGLWRARLLPAPLTMKPLFVEPMRTFHWSLSLAEIPWKRWSLLIAVAVIGSLLYGGSLGFVLTDWNSASAALWLALSAGLAWCVLIPVLWRFAGVALLPCLDACLVTMAVGEIVLTAGVLVNGLLWWSHTTTHAVEINSVIVALSNLVMFAVLTQRLRTHGVAPLRVWVLWMLGLNGSGALFFLVFYQWLHAL